MDGAGYLVSRLQRLTAVLMLAGLLVIGACAWLFPAKPIAPSWANGTYHNACCAPLILRGGVISSEGRSSTYRIESGKHGYILSVPDGIRVEAGHLRFGETTAYMEFNDSSGLHRADYRAKTVSIYNGDAGANLLFRQE